MKRLSRNLQSLRKVRTKEKLPVKIGNRFCRSSTTLEKLVVQEVVWAELAWAPAVSELQEERQAAWMPNLKRT
jgi:hypothetical protein